MGFLPNIGRHDIQIVLQIQQLNQKCLYVWMVLLEPLYLGRLIIFIIIISIFTEDNVFNTTGSLPYGPLVNTDIDYFRTFLLLFGLFHIRHAMLVMLYFVLGEEKPVLAL